MTGGATSDRGGRWALWVVEDEPASARLVAELCRAAGGDASVFPAPTPFLAALRHGSPPRAVVLDWRLGHEVSAALFLATRHRHPGLPVIYWTATDARNLPAMIREDGFTIIVDKAGGAASLERALAWAVTERRVDWASD